MISQACKSTVAVGGLSPMKFPDQRTRHGGGLSNGREIVKSEQRVSQQ